MNNFGTLYGFELKKILQRKMVWVTMLMMLLLCGVIVGGEVLGNYVVDGEVVDSHYHMMQTDRAYGRALTGRKVDQELLAEMAEAYGRLPEGEERYTLTGEYQRYARPYSAVLHLVRQTMGIQMEEAIVWQADEDAFYAGRLSHEEKVWDAGYLTEEEKTFWRKKEEMLAKPMVFAWDEGYSVLASAAYPLGLMLLLLIAISLSGVFPQEHDRRTDQLLLCSRLGKKQLYLAKMLAGVSFAAFASLVFSAVSIGTSLAVYGADGFDAPAQLLYQTYPWDFTVGEAVLILYGLMLAAAMLTGLFVMLLSEILHHALGTLAVVSGTILLTLFLNIPRQYVLASRIYGYFPCNLLREENAFDAGLVRFFGTFLTVWQAAPVFYLLLGIGFFMAGSRLYKRYQVSGR